MEQEETRTESPVDGATGDARPIELQTLLGALGVALPDGDGTDDAPGDGPAGGARPAELRTPFGAFAFTFTDDDGTVHEGAAALQKSLQALSALDCDGLSCGCGGAAASESPPPET
jgi:hypothetical protein